MLDKRLEDQKLELEYPCKWTYKVISTKSSILKKAVEDIVTKKYKLKKSNTSKAGKYISYSLEVTVDSEQEREKLYLDLKSHEQIKMVL
jgi:putative lipoic acid-binding regulatory protein